MNDDLARLATSWGSLSAKLAAANRILLVDDEPSVRELFSSVLEENGFDCATAATGEEALRRLTAERFHFMVVDNNLPGIGGLSVITKGHEIDPSCEAILTTAYPDLESIIDTIELRSVDYLLKPMDSIDLLVTVMGRAKRKRSRRLLARRMLNDLRAAVSARTSVDTVDILYEARDRVEKFQDSLKSKKRILVWSGESHNVVQPLAELESTGFTLWQKQSGADMLALCQHRQVSVLVISDHLGDMSGAELAKKLSDSHGRPELIFVTERSDFEDALDAVKRGAAGYILKPIANGRQLTHCIQRACESYQERVYHYKMVSELSTILSHLEKRPGENAALWNLKSALDTFDIKTARDVMNVVENSED